uniref:Uncharacterized protein n=1 Tax=Romanomermis culicivorax TaxID=13658 RepID=A0A915KWW6_ROMCU
MVMGTLVGPIVKQLVGGDTFNPNFVNFVRNRWQSRVDFKLKAVRDGQFVRGQNQKVEQFDKSVRESVLWGELT